MAHSHYLTISLTFKTHMRAYTVLHTHSLCIILLAVHVVYCTPCVRNHKQFQSGVDFIKIGFDKYETNWHFHFRSFRFILNDIRLSMSMCFRSDKGPHSTPILTNRLDSTIDKLFESIRVENSKSGYRYNVCVGTEEEPRLIDWSPRLVNSYGHRHILTLKLSQMYFYYQTTTVINLCVNQR